MPSQEFITRPQIHRKAQSFQKSEEKFGIEKSSSDSIGKNKHAYSFS